MDESVFNDFFKYGDYGDMVMDLQDFNDIIEEDGSPSPEETDGFPKQESSQDLSGGDDEHYGSLQIGQNYPIFFEGGEKFSHTSLQDTCANNVSCYKSGETSFWCDNTSHESCMKSSFAGDGIADTFCHRGVSTPAHTLSSTENIDLNGFGSHCERQASSTENSAVFDGEIIEKEALSPPLLCSQSSMIFGDTYDKVDEINNRFAPIKNSLVDSVSHSFCEGQPVPRFPQMGIDKHLINMKHDKASTSKFSVKIIHSEKQSRKEESAIFSDKNLKQLNSTRCNEVPVMSNRRNRMWDDRKCRFDQIDGMDSRPGKSKPGTLTNSSSIDKKYGNEDDGDLCIIENLSHPVYPAVSKFSGITSQCDIIRDPFPQTSIGPIRVKENERFLLQVALQDLSQPKSEINLPDGILTVPLLRHQRIALSWMVQKETTSFYCSGGILADDQGLGKTMSTIALIMAERSPTFKLCSEDSKQSKMETLNLDEDDEKIIDVDEPPRDPESHRANSNSIPDIIPEKNRPSYVHRQGRPAAGTLVVCPTSVLRQWSEELHNRVSNEANLSVLVYHGSNRTKDPFDLAKYDVVLTTYSIVSMEVPKQPLVDKDEDDKGIAEDVILPRDSSNKKRKYTNSIKSKKGIDGLTLESLARPLARVGWFRVVLDEAQSIKNHRTQVARACWGLRAKRRWCLSGTPIQNTIDDLYSYFRFLRYDPYAVYKSFCSTIKLPISRNPTSGYRKLQAVLRTIMLRRTKGTLLDGEPIIDLPPKSIELRKVDFSKEERDFYTKLENDSRAQFQVYAAAGTVKQNYVNILLMLLRLRQACDHPLLVRGNNSNLIQESSLEAARKLPWEIRCSLLHCLEASLALCSICNDPPEDAAVTICCHVFCNQCICDHLTGDDNHCPVSNCKGSLNMSSVFSKATLRISLSNELGSNCSLDSSLSKPLETAEPWAEDSSFDSSKIKAALQVLESLRPQDCSLKEHSPTEASACTERSKSESEEVSTSNSRKGFSTMNKGCTGNDHIFGEKAIVFSQWTRMLDLLESCLQNSFIPYRRLDGTMSIAARDRAVKEFNNLPEVSVMIMSLKAASLGLNMVAACHVLMLDLWWNPATEDQAVDRAHRIGQTRPVTVVRLTVRDTVEDRILALQEKKREMVGSVFGEDKTGQEQHTRLTVEDLRYLFMA